MAKLIKSDTEKARISLIPSDLKLVRFSVENSSLGLYFDQFLSKYDTVSELLFRAGIVRTFCQVEGVESVTFFVDENATYKIVPLHLLVLRQLLTMWIL